jgi:hypothetical protein
MSAEPVPAAIEEYLAGIRGERGDAVRTVFDTVHAAMPEGFELVLSYGMPGWVVPLSRYPVTYNKQPLAYVSIAAQKQYNSLYLMGCSADSAEDRAFREEWAATGLTLNMGKSCLRFRTLAEVDLGIIARTVAATSVDQFIELYERSRT